MRNKEKIREKEKSQKMKKISAKEDRCFTSLRAGTSLTVYRALLIRKLSEKQKDPSAQINNSRHRISTIDEN